MNSANLVGRVASEPELRYTANGKPVCTFRLAVNAFGGEKKADFLPIIVWNKAAEACANYLKKGKQCSVEGRISTRDYENKQGVKVYVTEIMANNAQFLDPPDKDGKKPADPFEDDGKKIDIDDADLPF